VDSVLAIRKGLTGGQEAGSTASDALRGKVEEVAVRSEKDGDEEGRNGEGPGLE
jgi:hypothetical protein